MVDALRRIHAALAPGGLLVDTQPVSPTPPVLARGERVGELDMREWGETITAIDRLFERAIDGLYTLELERRFVVTDSFDGGDELVTCVGEWQGTRVTDELRARVTGAESPFTVEQEVRLRLLRARSLPSAT